MTLAKATPEPYFLVLTWPLNAHWAEKTIKLFGELANQGIQRVVVNMEHVSFIDSHGLAALVKGAKLLGGEVQDLQLAALQAQAKFFLRLTRFDQVFQVFEDISALK